MASRGRRKSSGMSDTPEKGEASVRVNARKRTRAANNLAITGFVRYLNRIKTDP